MTGFSEMILPLLRWLRVSWVSQLVTFSLPVFVLRVTFHYSSVCIRLREMR